MKTSNTIAPIVNKEGLLAYDAESKAEIRPVQSMAF